MDAWKTLDTKLDFARRGIEIRCADPASRLPPAQPPHSQQDSRIPRARRRILIPSSRAHRICLFNFRLCLYLGPAHPSVVPLNPQQFSAANKLASALVKAEQPLRLLANSNPHTDADPPNRPQASAQPQNTIATQIHTIEPSVNRKCFRQPSRPSR